MKMKSFKIFHLTKELIDSHCAKITSLANSVDSNTNEIKQNKASINDLKSASAGNFQTAQFIIDWHSTGTDDGR